MNAHQRRTVRRMAAAKTLRAAAMAANFGIMALSDKLLCLCGAAGQSAVAKALAGLEYDPVMFYYKPVGWVQSTRKRRYFPPETSPTRRGAS